MVSGSSTLWKRVEIGEDGLVIPLAFVVKLEKKNDDQETNKGEKSPHKNVTLCS